MKNHVTRKDISAATGMGVEWVRRNDGIRKHRVQGVKGRALYRKSVWEWLRAQGFDV